jgi:DNA-directed RNA polymerase specialized sigma24 family protein
MPFAFRDGGPRGPVLVFRHPMRIEKDVLLRQYLDATGEQEVERLLVAIVEGVARPVIQRVVLGALARDAGGIDDVDDVVADTISDLLRRLRDLREGGVPIHDLRGYVATCAYNRCHERLRERYPARNRLRNQLHYLCGHHLRLGVWRSSHGTIVCGLDEWQDREPAPAAAAERVDLAARSDPSAENRAQLVTLVPEVLRAAGGPLELDALVSAVARLIDLEPQRAEADLAAVEQTSEPAADEALALRTSMRELWDNVRRLAARQRIALLLNLRDANGNDCLSLLPLTRTATIAEIAAALEMAPEALAALWNDLPLSDARIAELLGATPRQVIKLRRLGRERLRRMEKTRHPQNLGTELESSMTDLALVPGTRNRR